MSSFSLLHRACLWLLAPSPNVRHGRGILFSPSESDSSALHPKPLPGPALDLGARRAGHRSAGVSPRKRVHDSSFGNSVHSCSFSSASGPEERIYALERASITRTIETLLAGHINTIYKLPERVVIRDAVSGYTLIGVKKAWKYGRGKQFFLGDVALQPAEDKWVFRLEVTK